MTIGSLGNIGRRVNLATDFRLPNNRVPYAPTSIYKIRNRHKLPISRPNIKYKNEKNAIKM